MTRLIPAQESAYRILKYAFDAGGLLLLTSHSGRGRTTIMRKLQEETGGVHRDIGEPAPSVAGRDALFGGCGIAAAEQDRLCGRYRPDSRGDVELSFLSARPIPGNGVAGIERFGATRRKEAGGLNGRLDRADVREAKLFGLHTPIYGCGLRGFARNTGRRGTILRARCRESFPICAQAQWTPDKGGLRLAAGFRTVFDRPVY
jgi:hypothetical protein